MNDLNEVKPATIKHLITGVEPEKPKGKTFTIEETLYRDERGKLTKNKKYAVTKVYIKGQTISMAEAQKAGLANFNPDDVKSVEKAPENKMQEPKENKGWGFRK